MKIRLSDVWRTPILRSISLAATTIAILSIFGCDMRPTDPLAGMGRDDMEGDESDNPLVDTAERGSEDIESRDEASSDRGDGESPDGSCGVSTRDDFELIDQPGDGLRDGDVRRVGHIIDGDTLDVIVDGEGVKLRLKGMNTPECDKDRNQNYRYRCVRDDEGFGLAAYEALFDIAENATVRIDCDGASEGEECELDPYDRYLAYIEIPCVGDAGEALVKQGLAMTFTRYQSEKLATYCAAEYAARESRSGMWEGGSISSMLALMNDGTRSWYRSHDARCDAAIEELSNASP